MSTPLDALKVNLRAREIIVLAMAGVWLEYRGSPVESSIADALAEHVEQYERACAAVSEEEQRPRPAPPSGPR